MITLADIAKYDYRAREDLVFQNLVNDCLNIIRRFKDGITHDVLLEALREDEKVRPNDSKHYAQTESFWIMWVTNACYILEKLGYIERFRVGVTIVYKPL